MKKLSLSIHSGMAAGLLLAASSCITDKFNECDEYYSTYASFTLNKIYAGNVDETQPDNESVIKDALALVYKFDGTPEAMGYIAASDVRAELPENAGETARITLKCQSGEKLIYIAVNVGGNKLVDAGQTATNISAANKWVGLKWTAEKGIAFATVNTPVWSAGASSTAISSTPDTATTADGLIKALSGNGDPSQGVLSGAGTAYFMSNWGPDGEDTDGTDDVSTCRFTLHRNITSTDSRTAPPDATNANGQNALLINMQSALTQVALDVIPGQALNNAGTGTNAGVFVPDEKWVVGNINMSAYPFQQFDGSTVKSTRYDDTAHILPAGKNQKWANKMDNSRWIPSGSKAYERQDLTVTEVRDRIHSHPANQPFGTANKVFIIENSNRRTLAAYSTFVLFSGQYRPNSYIICVSNNGTVFSSGAFPAAWPANNTSTNEETDTLYYVSSIGNGTFFLGMKALRQYVGYRILNLSPAFDATTHAEVAAYIMDLRTASGNERAALQAYYRGYCFYREWIRDERGASAADRISVHRNYIYEHSVTKLNEPGIANPNDIITPYEYEPVEETGSYVTTEVRIMNWHVIHQIEPGLN
ncbi:MAG: fimbria major subunit [Tannerella sp.]|jgi:hypothetical protein|nr:fimbria major subunit [Tannerella sp.]